MVVDDGPPGCAHASFALPWDDADAPPPVDALRDTRTRLGDTFTLDSGEDNYLFLFSDEGLRSFYGLAERDASKGLADYRMLLRKLPPELFDGRRTFAHDLFGAQHVEDYLGMLEAALDAEIAALGDGGRIEAFEFARRLGHRLGLACWIGPEVAVGADFGALVADLDQLDGAESFVHPVTIASVRGSDYAAERAALRRVEQAVGRVLDSSTRSDFLSRISDNWDGVAEPERTQGIARDVVLLHVATMTNLVAALGWTLVRILDDPSSVEMVRSGDAAAIDRCALEAIRLGQRSIMMRTALRTVEIDDGTCVRTVERNTILATMVPITNTDPAATVAGAPLDQWSPDRWTGHLRSGPEGLTAAEQVTTFGHGSHRCPARRFSMSAISMTLRRLFDEFDLQLQVGTVPGSLTHQIGGVGRAGEPCPISYRRHPVTGTTPAPRPRDL